MRAVLGIVGLLVVLAVVGLTARQQLAPKPAVTTPGATAGQGGEAASAPQQQVQQFKQAIDASLQQARPMPDEVK